MRDLVYLHNDLMGYKHPEDDFIEMEHILRKWHQLFNGVFEEIDNGKKWKSF